MIDETKASGSSHAPRGLRSLSRSFVAHFVLFAISCFAVSVAQAAIGYSVRSDDDKKLYRIDLATGAATAIGDTNFAKIEALAMNAAFDLFGVNPSTAQLVKCSIDTGICTAVGTLGVTPIATNVGLAFDPSGKLYMSMSALVYVVDPANANVAPLGSSGAAISGLASGAVTSGCPSGLYAIGGNSDQGRFYCINTSTGAATQIGTVGSPTALDGGFDADFTTGLVWGVTNGTTSQLYAIDPRVTPIAATNVKPVTLNGVAIGGFESLAVRRSVVADDANDAAAIPLWGAPWAVSLVLFLIVFAAHAQRRRDVRRAQFSVRS
jgi:hypothetical protein